MTALPNIALCLIDTVDGWINKVCWGLINRISCLPSSAMLTAVFFRSSLSTPHQHHSHPNVRLFSFSASLLSKETASNSNNITSTSQYSPYSNNNNPSEKKPNPNTKRSTPNATFKHPRSKKSTIELLKQKSSASSPASPQNLEKFLPTLSKKQQGRVTSYLREQWHARGAKEDNNLRDKNGISKNQQFKQIPVVPRILDYIKKNLLGICEVNKKTGKVPMYLRYLLFHCCYYYYFE